MATLITGLGYVGSALAARLLAAGERVVGLENFFSSPEEQVRALSTAGELKLTQGSVSDARLLRETVDAASIDTVFHLAAQASAQPDAASIEYTCETNLEGTRRLLAVCAEAGVARVILASSMRLYATPLPHTVTEESPLRPSDLVHLSQLYGETLLAEYQRRGAPWRAAAARMGIVHGVSRVMKQNPDFLAVPQRFCWQAAREEPLRVATGPESVLAFVHVDDAVDALLRCRDLDAALTVANVATEVRSVAQVAQAVRRQGERRGLNVRIEPPDLAQLKRSVRVESVLGTLRATPSRRLRASMGSVLEYYLAHTSPATQNER